MRILWGALRAVSVETMGILVVLWMLHGATGLSIDAPWRATKSPQPVSEPGDSSSTLVARAVSLTTTAPQEKTHRQTQYQTQFQTQRATMRQWFNTRFPASGNKGAEESASQRRAKYTRERLEHFSRLYGIAVRD